MSPAGVAPAKRRLFSQIESESERITGNTSITERRTETSVTVRLRASSDRLKVRGQDRYLYRAVDSTGQTIDFLLTARRDAASAKRFFRKLFLTSANVQPRVINVDRNPAYPVAVEQLKRDGTVRRRCRVRQCKYLNNMIEQDHRTVKRRVWLAMGYGSFRSAWRTLRGIEAVSMIRKGRARWVAKTDPKGQARFIHWLFGIAA